MHGPTNPRGGNTGPEGEQQLVGLCLAGDPKAQEELVRRYGAIVWSVCSRGGLPAAEAEDVAQEVFCSAFTALPHFRGECRLSTWFYTLALRRMADHLRAPARRDIASGVPSSPAFPGPRRVSEDPSPETLAVDGQRHRLLRAALDDLGEPARSVLSAFYLGEMSVASIARALGLPEGTVKTHLHRGRQRLREQLRDLC
jgi:RNA polymerase sigma-70 factor, ECF subfamily